MIKKVLKDLRLQNIFKIWYSVLTKLMTTGRWVGGSVDLIKPIRNTGRQGKHMHTEIQQQITKS